MKAWVVSYLPSNLWACGRCHYCWDYECGYAEAFAERKGIHQKAGFVGWCNCYYLRKALLLQHMFIVVKEFKMYNLPKTFVVILGGQWVLCIFDFIYGIMRIPTQPPFFVVKTTYSTLSFENTFNTCYILLSGYWQVSSVCVLLLF